MKETSQTLKICKLLLGFRNDLKADDNHNLSRVSGTYKVDVFVGIITIQIFRDDITVLVENLYFCKYRSKTICFDHFRRMQEHLGLITAVTKRHVTSANCEANDFAPSFSLQGNEANK